MTPSSRLAGSGLWTRLAACVVLACAPLALALLTEDRWAGEDARVIFLLAFGLALATGAVLLLRTGDAREARAAAAPERALRQARDQQAATAEILTAIAASPPDLQRVLDTIARNAARVCDGIYAVVFRSDGAEIRLAAHHGLSPSRLAALNERYPMALNDEGLVAGVIRTASMVHFPDLLSDPKVPTWLRDLARTQGFRSLVVVPMVQDGRAIGCLNVSRPEGGFSERQIQLLQTFAAQAAIAIENTRLFQELEARNRDLTEALERETATSGILRAIATSPTDPSSVFEAILESALRLCGATIGAIDLLDGEQVSVAAIRGRAALDDAVKSAFPRRLTDPGLVTHAIREGVVIHVADVLEDPRSLHDLDEAGGMRAELHVPMLREGRCIGSIDIARDTPGLFSEAQVALLHTLGDQAAIAVENVRLFQELEARNRELTEALEQQTATAEILRVISSSPTDLVPVMDAVARNAARLARADHALIGEAAEGRIRWLAASGCPLSPEGPPISRQLPSGRAILDCQTTQVEDVTELTGDFVGVRRAYDQFGVRTILATPLVREGLAIGVLLVRRTEVRPFAGKEIDLLRTFADQAVIAIENVRLFQELAARNRDLTEALDQQTATAEILRVISSSPTDLPPVLDAVAESAARVCGATDSHIGILEGDVFRVVAMHGDTRRSVAIGDTLSSSPATISGRAVRERRTIHIEDFAALPETEYPETWVRVHRTQSRTRTTLVVPLLREDLPLGAITIRREVVQPFSDKQIALLETFAAQAVIAIENVRLFQELAARNRELTEALEQQTATAEILAVISRSPTDLQPVLEAVVRSASRLCGAANVSLYRVEGQLMRKVAEQGPPLTALGVGETRPIRRTTISGRAMVDRTTIHVPEHQTAEAAREYPDARRDTGIRTAIGIPLLREGVAIGAFSAYRTEPRPFSEREIALLQTFADQAVIAIENVRLFTEIQARNRELTESLEQQTATAEILRVISSSPTDVQPVFDSILERAMRLADAVFGAAFSFDGERIHQVAHRGLSDEALAIARRVYPMVPSSEQLTGVAVLERRVVHVRDVDKAPEASATTRQFARTIGFRALLAVPMLREGRPVGVLTVTRAAGEFSARHIELVKIFADQAVIAIENVRLFQELGARNRELTEALEQQTATAEILRAISSSPTDTQPVFDTIAEHAVRVCDARYCTVFRFDGTLVHLVAHNGLSPAALHEFQQTYPVPLEAETLSARSIRGRVAVHSPDMLAVPESSEAIRRMARAARAGGYRSGIAIPMLRGGAPIGAIVVSRSAADGGPRAFVDREIALLQTFADQGVIAVENVRLFRELEARTRELARSVEELQALSDVGRAVSSTLDLPTVLDTIVARAVQLSGTSGGGIYEYDEIAQEFQLRASHRTEDELVEALRATPIRLGEGATGQAVLRRAPVEVVDILDDQYQVTRTQPIFARLGYRSALSLPLLLERRILGALTVWRRETGGFPPETVSLLQTFAAQSVLAIQNARLFREIEAKGRELEVASRHKSQFLANMSHELRTPLNAILGYTELLIDGIYGDLAPKAGDVMARIDRSGKHLLGLINDVLDLSKIEAGQLELSLADYSLAEVINTVVTQVESLAAEKSLILHATVAPGLPAGRGDERRLAQVLLNLVGNAIKFTEVGSVRVVAHRDGDAFVVAVADTGPGIAEADRQRIFEEFQQADSSSTRKKGGTGLGLSIAKRIVELHGGRIWVESIVGRGSTFSVRVPVRVERQAARA